jgi:hypothetical protein
MDAAPTQPLTRRASRARFVVAQVPVDSAHIASAASEGSAGDVVDAAPDAPVDAMLAADPEIAVSVDELPDLQPDALHVPDLADEVPLAADAPDGERLLDEFEAAARLFAFTGETPVQVAASALADEPDEHTTPAPAPRRRGRSFARAATASFSVGVVGVVGLLTVGMTTPIEAVAAASGTSSVAAATAVTGGDVAGDLSADIQAYVAPAEVQGAPMERADSFEMTSRAELAAESGISNFSDFFVNDPDAAIQWPFAVGVPITYGFGMRSGRMHEGIDFVPGAGSPVQAIADGTVRIATESGGAFGVTVLIDHVIDGQVISSRYAHMQYGSLQVVPGQQVGVGTFIGRTGNTGRSYGAHTHFELLAGGTTPIDPLPWLREHTG